jgi:hypothetical protein
MTQQVGILCGGKIFKQVFSCILLIIIASSLFLTTFASVFAQGGPTGGAGPVPNGTVNNPSTLPTGGPGTFTGAGAGNLGGTPNSGGLSSGGQTINDASIQGGGAASVAAAEAQASGLAASENLGALDDPVLQFLHKYILTGIGSFVGYTGKAFDYAIEEYIIGFGNLYINKNVGVAIDSLWSTVRDIFNLTFIFGLVYIGFKMILDSSDSSARKMLVSLIGAALLVNFSLFITKFVVDFSNIAATQIYQAFGDTNLPEFSITNGFMTMMGINRLIGVEMTASAGYAYIVGMLIVFAVLIYVFLAGAIMIIIRFVVLCIYMVFSPMMFLGWVFPAMKGHSEKYWKGFLNQAFFAPAFIFMLYLSYRVTYTFNYTTKDWGNFFGQGVAEPIGVDGLIPFFAMVIIFLLASIMVAKNMGAVGASTVVSVGNNIRGRAQVALGAGTAGMAARLGRSTIGASANALAQNDRFKLVAARTGIIGKGVYNATAGVADSSFDARKVGGVGKALGIGEGKKGGFVSRVKEDKESDEKFLKALGTRDADKYDPATKSAKADVEKWEDLADKEVNLIKKAEYQENAKAAKKNYDSIKNQYSAREEFKYQLAYAKAIESWQKTQLAALTVAGGATAGIITGGILPAIAATGIGGLASMGSYYNNKQVTGALRKEYGKNGLKKRKNSHEEHQLKKALAALGDDHNHEEKPKDEHKDSGHSTTPKPKPSTPTSSSAPSPSGKASGGTADAHH